MKMMKLMALLMASVLMLTACQSPVEPAPTQHPVIVTDEPQTQEEASAADETLQDDADEEDAVEFVEMSGTIEEITGEYLIITDANGMTVQVNLSAETIFEADPAGELAVKDYVHIIYNGMMTRSLPPQITAIKVGCYSRTGVISGITEDRFTLTTEAGEEIWVNLQPGQQAVNQATNEQVALTEGAKLTVYFNGAMTMSLPAQIGASLIVTVPEKTVEAVAETATETAPEAAE